MKHLLVAILLLLCISSADLNAQCSVCRMGAETNIQKENGRGKGLNMGILYLMAVPYLMGGVAGVIWWRNKKKNPTQISEPGEE